MNWLNDHRLMEPIGNIPPAEFEMTYYRQIKESADAAIQNKQSPENAERFNSKEST